MGLAGAFEGALGRGRWVPGTRGALESHRRARYRRRPGRQSRRGGLRNAHRSRRRADGAPGVPVHVASQTRAASPTSPAWMRRCGRSAPTGSPTVRIWWRPDPSPKRSRRPLRGVTQPRSWTRCRKRRARHAIRRSTGVGIAAAVPVRTTPFQPISASRPTTSTTSRAGRSYGYGAAPRRSTDTTSWRNCARRFIVSGRSPSPRSRLSAAVFPGDLTVVRCGRHCPKSLEFRLDSGDIYLATDGTSIWPSVGTYSWPQMGTFTWPRTLVHGCGVGDCRCICQCTVTR